MEGNEVENRTRLVVSQDEYDYINGIITANDVIIIEGITFIKREKVIEMLGKFANEHCENLNAELTRTSKELDDMTTKYNELSRKYDDLYRKHKPA